MSDQFPIATPVVTATGGELTQTSVQLAFNTLTLAVRSALNILAAGTPPIGPAGGDLSGTYPNPTVAAVHATAGTIDNVVIGGLVPAAGTFTALSASSLVLTSALSVANGGTGRATLTAHGVLLGEGTAAINQTAVGTTGQMLLGVTGADPAFGNNPTITGGTVDGAPIGGTTPAAGTFTALSSTSGALNGTVGATTPNAGSFTTLAASSTVSGAGFVARFSTPGPIGNTTPSTGAFTTLTASTPVGVPSGGTGQSTLTAHGVLIGEGTAAINQTAVGTTGQALIGQTGADPIFGFPTGALINIQRITSTQVYNSTAGTNSVVIELQAPGGGGGGAPATGAGQNSVGSGGGAGGYCRTRLITGFNGVTVTIGASGTTGAGVAGGAGGACSFGAILTANGGAGGPVTGPSASPNSSPAAGGTASGGTLLNISGNASTFSSVAPLVTGCGAASSMLGAGGIGVYQATGGAASGFGAGGGGTANNASVAAVAGGAAAPGVCIIYEYA